MNVILSSARSALVYARQELNGTVDKPGTLQRTVALRAEISRLEGVIERERQAGQALEPPKCSLEAWLKCDEDDCLALGCQGFR